FPAVEDLAPPPSPKERFISGRMFHNAVEQPIDDKLSVVHVEHPMAAGVAYFEGAVVPARRAWLLAYARWEYDSTQREVAQMTRQPVGPAPVAPPSPVLRGWAAPYPEALRRAPGLASDDVKSFLCFQVDPCDASVLARYVV